MRLGSAVEAIDMFCGFGGSSQGIHNSGASIRLAANHDWHSIEVHSRDRMYVVFWKRGNRAPDLDYRPAAYCTSQRCGGEHIEAVQSWKPSQLWEATNDRSSYHAAARQAPSTIDPRRHVRSGGSASGRAESPGAGLRRGGLR